MTSEGPVTEQEAFILADEAPRVVVDKSRDDQWDLDDDAQVPDDLPEWKEEAGDNSKGDLLGDHSRLYFARNGEAAVPAARRPVVGVCGTLLRRSVYST